MLPTVSVQMPKESIDDQNNYSESSDNRNDLDVKEKSTRHTSERALTPAPVPATIPAPVPAPVPSASASAPVPVTASASAPSLKMDDMMKVGPISQQEKEELVRNLDINTGAMMVNYEKGDKRFNVRTPKDEYIGSFTASNIIKYAGSLHTPEFMTHIDTKIQTDAEALIESFVGKISLVSGVPVVNLQTVSHSPFMGDVELLMRLNNDLYRLEKDELEKELRYVDKKKEHVRFAVKKFIYSLLNYTMSLIAVVVEQSDTEENISKLLLKYSVGLMYRIFQFVQEQIKNLTEHQQDLFRMVESSNKLRGVIESKVDGLIKSLAEQNEALQKQEQRMYRLSQSGGDDSDSSEFAIMTFSDDNNNDQKGGGEDGGEDDDKEDQEGGDYVESESHFSAIYDI
jgi:hypothetical protein